MYSFLFDLTEYNFRYLDSRSCPFFSFLWRYLLNIHNSIRWFYSKTGHFRSNMRDSHHLFKFFSHLFSCPSDTSCIRHRQRPRGISKGRHKKKRGKIHREKEKDKIKITGSNIWKFPAFASDFCQKYFFIYSLLSFFRIRVNILLRKGSSLKSFTGMPIPKIGF